MNHLKSTTWRCSLGLTCFLIWITACGHQQADLAVRETRSVSPADRPAPVSDQERFGWHGLPSAQAAAPETVPASNELTSAGTQATEPDFDYKVPEGWREVEPTQFRNINFVFGESDAGQCYLTVLSGSGGGVAENVNRWRAQMGLPRLSESDMSDLPAMKMLEKNATYVELKGNFKGMGGQPELTGAMLIGALLEMKGRAIFIKMVGPDALVTVQREKFKQFCSSLKSKSVIVKQNEEEPQRSDQGATFSPQNLPAGHPPLTELDTSGTSGSAMMMPPPSAGSNRLKWDTPEGWRVKKNQPMRAASFTVPAASGEADCGMFLLPGVAGGMGANINRWRQQMDMPALNDEEVSKLPETDIAGKKGKLVELTGSYKGMGGTPQKDYMLLGVICDLDGDSLFVKLTGPEVTVRKERKKFLKFCSEVNVIGQ